MTNPAPAELVVLLAEDGTPIGEAPKATVHGTVDSTGAGAGTPLHLAFSCHVYSPAGDLLLTRRALSKPTWPGVWTNSFCGHPGPGERLEDAVRRRALEELGLRLDAVESLLPDFRYRAVDAGGTVENEVCPVFRAVASGDPDPAPGEVAEWAWTTPGKASAAIAAAPFAFSPWLVLQHAAGALEHSGEVASKAL